MNQPYALIIEDDSRNMRVLGILLSIQGVAHRDVLNPAQVLSLLPTLDKLDVVFLDLEMPTFNGYDILKLLKNDPRFAKVPVVAYTVHVSEANNARKAGFHSFIAKPIIPERFPDQLARILRSEPVWDRA